MNFDVFTLAAVTDELNEKLTGGRVQDSLEIGNEAVGLEIYAGHTRHYVLLSAHPQEARLHLVPERLRRGVVDGTVLSASAFALRYMLGGVEDRLLVVNLGCTLDRASIADPLIAPPRGCDWRVEWSSEDSRYGGAGTPNLWPDDRWCIPGESAVVLVPEPAQQRGPRLQRRTA